MRGGGQDVTRTLERDNGTDRRLRLLVGLVVFVAGVSALISLRLIARDGLVTQTNLTRAVALTFLVAVAATVNVRIRIRATTHGISWTDAASVVGLAVAPVPWVILATGLGVAIARAMSRLPPVKFAFGIAKEMTLAAAGGLVLVSAGWTWPWSGSIGSSLPALVLAYLTVVVLDELLMFPVLAFATGTPILNRFRQQLDLRLASVLARFSVVLSTLLILRINAAFLVVVPPLVLSLHLANSSRPTPAGCAAGRSGRPGSVWPAPPTR
jgi:hypothetical protein